MNHWEWQLLEDKSPVGRLKLDGVLVGVGSRVRLAPKKRGDIMDLALTGQIAIIESIEQDYENKIHICVILEEDPGRDLGFLRQPGHRFFFDMDEIEPVSGESASSIPGCKSSFARILVAGIGNIFLGDDGFGVEVIRRLALRSWPAEVKVVDFGIRGLDLAYALQDGYETTILVDAYAHEQPPGTVSLIEPDSGLAESPAVALEPHGMNPMNVLRLAAAMHGNTGKLLLVGCEPLTFGPEEGLLGLSKPVEAAVDEAVSMICSVVERTLQESKQSAESSN
jgi:hydrogenase maturation protease